MKYRSGNELNKVHDYPGWKRYFDMPGIFSSEEEVQNSGSYELARNWRLLNGLAGGRPVVLVNLGRARIFSGPEGKRLDGFVSTLVCSERTRFIRLRWPNLLSAAGDFPPWFAEYCQSRGLID